MEVDVLVQLSQRYLNETYTGTFGYQPIVENGFTGWPTMFALTRALQIELGISSPTNNFGDGTRAAFESQVGVISSTSGSQRVVSLLNCALWCKGYPSAAPEGSWGDTQDASIGNIRFNMGLPTSPLTVTSKMLKSLLTMDAYTALPGGSAAIRDGQRWLNGRYAGRQNFYISPTDGLFTRQLQTAIMYGIQYEIGMSDSVANGNFGPGTKTGIQTNGVVGPGDSDGAKAFVRLYQIALACNGYDVQRTGTFDSATLSATLEFQSFMEIAETGTGNYGTWAALLVSTGDPDRPVSGMDTSTPLTTATAATRFNEGYRVVGRYLTVTGKAIVPGEIPAILNAGMKLFPIFQNYNNAAYYFTKELGRDHGFQAVARARELGLGATPIFFAVDYDATGDEANTIVIDYFEGIREGVSYSTGVNYGVGVYGTRNVCNVLSASGHAEGVWVSGMSTGYSGNLGFRMPVEWMYNQIKEISSPSLDRDAVSGRASPLNSSQVATTPLHNGEFHRLHWGNKSPGGDASEVYGFMKLQVIAEKHLRRQGASDEKAGQIVMFWLQQRRYSGGVWTAYTPPFELWVTPLTTLQKVKAAMVDFFSEVRSNFYDAAPAQDSAFYLDAYYDGEVEHMAATAHGVYRWGAHAGSSSAGSGDAGGWALDLVSLWANYMKEGQSETITSWVLSNLGATGADAASRGFGRADLISDADGWLVGRQMADNNTSWGEAWRRTLVNRPADLSRVGDFLNGRFGSTPGPKIESCVEDIFTSSLFSVMGVGTSHFLDGESPPSPAQRAEFAQAVAARLIQLS